MAELRFIDKVAEYAQVSNDQATALTEATLRTLSQRISGGEAADLADRMPDPLRPLLVKSQEEAEAFPFEEFIDRVAAETGLDHEIARRGVGAVLQAMHATVGHKEFEDFMSQLPKDFGQVIQTVPRRH